MAAIRAHGALLQVRSARGLSRMNPPLQGDADPHAHADQPLSLPSPPHRRTLPNRIIR
ncbi:hypothetical protein PKB_1841 [Pseudomonas knackmussii B13]|uniref:Uncharacterized protein n=1 Tax=Pseudomonas knackmussii (strain DSM 6978 / CCUG 54928 / LMG 23759 / B13) TaxID=1301098 RepID=A0A024HEB7_PSEKB|nr:hypothetical protein PKB_1841 [Pseudomonas knackmussii B13]